MLGDSFSCLIGLLNLERDCSLANRMPKVQCQFQLCYHAVVYIYYIVFEQHFCVTLQSVLNNGIEVLETHHWHRFIW